MNEGTVISYVVLKEGVPVYAADGVEVGTVASVLAVAQQDIFHGIVLSTPDRALRFVAADQVAVLHEAGVDLRIDSASVALLPAPERGGGVFDAEDPGLAQGWHHWVRTLTGRGDWNRER
ncbi:MAG: PRC-barrel domain-containing protein [Solirubrobacteraceae bacterium]